MRGEDGRQRPFGAVTVETCDGRRVALMSCVLQLAFGQLISFVSKDFFHLFSRQLPSL